MKNKAHGDWTEEDTNWSEKDIDVIRDILKEQLIPVTYEELLKQHESKIV